SEGRLRATKLGERRTHPYLVKPDDVEHYLRETRKGPRPLGVEKTEHKHQARRIEGERGQMPYFGCAEDIAALASTLC
ncbi:MAG TPA: hypothetical protein VGW38_28850, partial [Chloroflexota bacterium]|nr:hypothetical protein [Chloroflexota bacterium]